jgi:hypothetical protein
MSEPLWDGSTGPELVVPASWKRASLGAPVPVVRCTYIFPDTHDRPGEQCKKWSLRGTTLCVKHGAALPTVRAHAEAMVEAARLRLIGATDEAVDWLLELAESSTSDAVRLKATTEVLDRAGVRGGVEVDVTVGEKVDPAQALRDRLAVLRKRTIEGELVDRAAVDAATEALEDDSVLPTPSLDAPESQEP